MLLTMRALTHAARGLAYTAAAQFDAIAADEDEAKRARAERRLALLTPMVKAWCSDVAVEVVSFGVQVHGGTGYVDDSEISQLYRDARIGPIFEGTNYIQAQDLLARKVIRDGGAALGDLLGEMERAAGALRDHEMFSQLAGGLRSECGALRAAVAGLVAAAPGAAELVGCVAHPFLHWLATVAGAWQHALAAADALDAGAQASTSRMRIDDARFYAARILPRARVYAAAVASGTDVITSPEPAEI
jgi:hypothetical protein